MKIELDINDEEKIYTISHATGRHYRKLMEYDETIDYSDMDVSQMDELVGFVCEVFRNQFDVDEFYDGIPSHEVLSTVTDVFVFVRTGKTSEELEKEQKNQGNEVGK